jgi:hypothetical protein
MKLSIKKDSTSVTVYLFIQNSAVTTGAGLTGLVYNSSSLTAYYVRPLGSATSISLATQTVTGAYSSGGFVEVHSSNMPGVYRLDLPNAVFATGVDSVVVMLFGATNMAPCLLEIQLVSYNPNDSTALGLSLLPSNVTQIASDATAATRLKNLFTAVTQGTVDTGTFTATTTAFETSITTNLDKFTNEAIYFVTGDNAGFTSGISGYDFTNSKVKLTIDAAPNAPSNGDTFLVFGKVS